jgi:pimeloyl-ACP methyl ester carboxylesterase
MTRKRALWVTGGIAAVLFVVLALIDNRMWDEGGPGIIDFELAGSARDAREILTEWGPDGRDAAKLSLWLDFPFLIAYGAFWALAAAACRDIARRQGWARLARLGPIAIVLAPVAAGCDALEDVFLLLVVGGHGGSAGPVLAAGFASVKFLTLVLAELYVVVVVVRRLHRASPLAFRTFAGAAIVLGVLAVAVATRTESRETRPAKPDIGRILSLPGGDIQVRDDGPRDAPPVVLIHGFGCSLRWWDEVTPALARELHVVRLDLLGFGGSEKPRHGYSMQNQADIVAQVMERLRIPRAPIVGHSMGGIVGTAFAERHRAMVTRLMMIGTSPDDRDEHLAIAAKATGWPVVGQLIHMLVSDRIVRHAVEGGMAPEVDPPKRLAHDIFGRTTWSSFDGSSDAINDYWDAKPLHERLAATGVPVTVLLGEEEDHTKRSVRLYNSIGARTVVMQGLDHTPQVEASGRTAPLLLAFARG